MENKIKIKVKDYTELRDGAETKIAQKGETVEVSEDVGKWECLAERATEVKEPAKNA